MSDIKQAAKWMQEGKRVRRRGWGEHYAHVDAIEGPMLGDEEHPCIDYLRLLPESILADDWEIAE